MYDITAIGELLIDFTPGGKTETGYPVFEQNPGGAPANVACCAARLGAKTAFIGKVGRDGLGFFLKSVLDNEGVTSDGLVLDGDAETTLAFVHLDDDGGRSFSFYRTNGADKALRYGEINRDILEASRVIHFGSLSLTDEPSRTAVTRAVREAGDAKIIAFDPNWRESLWRDKREGIRLIAESLSYADIVKMSEEELLLLSEANGIERGIDEIIAKYPRMSVLAVTLGANGCFICSRDAKTHIRGVTEHSGRPLKAADSTGAGDCFHAALLTGILGRGARPQALGIDALREIASRANLAASLCVTKKGGIPSMPFAAEVDRYSNH